MNSLSLEFAGAALDLRGSRCLWWPAQRLLCVSDLHLGKSERIARRGGPLLPPFDGVDTLARLSEEIAQLDPRLVVCLGDSFDDLAAAEALPDAERMRLDVAMAGRDWIWIEGNHDPGPVSLSGTHLAELALDGLTFRHIAHPQSEPGEISGHYHPKVILHTRGKTVRRAAFVHDRRRLMLPAFGTFTGGLNVRDSAICGLMEPDAQVIMAGRSVTALPLSGLLR